MTPSTEIQKPIIKTELPGPKGQRNYRSRRKMGYAFIIRVRIINSSPKEATACGSKMPTETSF